jgi:hypothetical protein
MAGKSIEDILRQQAAQRQAQIQQQQAQERAIYEQRERQRQDYLERMRMYEALNTVSPAAAAAAAGGRSNSSIPTINGHAEFILFKTSDLDNWQYVILDYLAETISDVKDTGIINTSDYDTYMIENTGWVVEFDNDILFINDNAEVISSISKDNQERSINIREYYYSLFNDGTLVQFNGKVVTTFTGIPTGTDYTSLKSTKNGLVIIKYDLNFDINVYVWNPTIGAVNVWSGSGNPGTRRFNEDGCKTYDNATFFCVEEYNDTAGTWSKINIYGEDGTTKSYLDVDALSASNLTTGYGTFFGDNKLEYFFYSSDISVRYYFNIYDGDTDTWKNYWHSRSATYQNEQRLYQDQYDGSQYTSLSNGIFHILHDGSTQSSYNIDKYRRLDVVWSIDGYTYNNYIVNNSATATKGVDINDANRDGFNGTSLYVGKSIFLPLINNDSKISLLCLTATQSLLIPAATTTGLNGSQGENLIPGWNSGQQYASFRVGDNFGIWLAYASNDVYKIYNEFGANVISLTMSAGTILNYTGDLAVVSNNTTEIEYVFNANTLGLSPSYATYSTLPNIDYYGPKPTYTDGDTTPSLILNLNEGGLSRIFTNEDVVDFTPNEFIWGKWLSDEYIILEGRDGANYNLYFYDWSGNLLATVDTGISTGLSYDANLVKDRVYFRVVDGSTTTYYYFSPTKTDSFTVENETGSNTNYDYWSWWID